MNEDNVVSLEHEKKVLQQFNELKKKIANYFPEAELEILEQSFQFSKEKHKTQKRKSGEPYILHPLAVANILAEMKLDIVSIMTGLLHDTVEDTSATQQDIISLFGEDTAHLVDGVTKISKINFKSSHEKQAENFRKMLMAMAKDIRVILVKLADRTHNMRTLDHMSPSKQKRIAEETLDIYAPLANRLGISWMKIELEDLSLRYSKPEIYYKLSKLIEKKKNEREEYITTVIKVIQDKLLEYGLKSNVTGRAKHFYSILKKMESRNVPFEEIHDIIAFRIITHSLQECYEALGLVHSFFKPVPGRFKDYIAMPKNNLYQSLHTTVIGPFGERLEIQIRTDEMHSTAEGGIAAHWQYKEGKIIKKDYEKFKWLRQILEAQEDVDNPKEFLDSVKLDLFSRDVYIFTPNGEILEFPYGSTPIDFAFSIHTDLGMKCNGAKVNGRIVPLKHKLKSGDTVEIISSINQKPNKDWLKYVKTGKARTKIRQFIKSEEREQAKLIGTDLLDKEFKKHSKSYPKWEKKKETVEHIKTISFANIDELLISIGYGKHSAQKIFYRLFPELEKASPSPEKSKKSFFQQIFSTTRKKQNENQSSRSAVKIDGLDDVLVRFSSCCHPIAGDEISGFISRGRGVAVHRSDCVTALSMDKDREVDVEWTQKASELARHIKIKILCNDEQGLLNKMSQVITSQGVNITSLNIKVNVNKKATGIFDLEVKNKAQLAQCIRALEGLHGIIAVERL